MVERILIVRHGLAGNGETARQAGLPDEERVLTPEGYRQVVGALRGLRRLVPELSLLATSPLPRAWQTAELIGDRYRPRPTLTGRLHGGSPDSLLEWVSGLRPAGEAPIALVGHEPQLSQFVGLLLTGHACRPVRLEKAGMCLLSLERGEAGSGRLEWLLTPWQLQQLGEHPETGH